MNTNIAHKIRPAGLHILTIGKDLIHDNSAAVVELVKNAYDADSPDVQVEFKKSPTRGGYSIIISDRGHGMSRDDVIDKWMVPSTRDKFDKRISRGGRVMQGNKGVGRYAASILGNDLLLETVSVGGEKTTAHFVWKDFEFAKYLDEVEIPLETIRVSNASGTRLIINGDNQFREEWDQKQFDALKFELKKLKSPMSPVFKNDEFRIKLKVTGFPGVENSEEVIEPYLLFDFFDYKIEGKIRANGKGVLTYSSQKARNIPEEKIAFDIKEEVAFDFENSFGCGEFQVDIRVYDRDNDAIESLIGRGLKEASGNYVGKNQARQLLNAYNGMSVYRNGFRIRPLGDADFDWLKLNARRIQNPSLHLGNNQVIGYVHIDSVEWSGLEEKSARDGLKENEAFNRLKEVTLAVLRQLERRRFEYRRKAGLSRPAIKVERELTRLFSFDELQHSVLRQLTEDGCDQPTIDRISELFDNAEKDKDKDAYEIRQALRVYQGQATLGKIINVIVHEGSQPLSYFRNQIPNLRYWREKFEKTGDLEKLEKMLSIADGVEENMEIFVKLFGRLDPLAAGKRAAKKPLELKKTIENTLSVFENEMKSEDVSAEITGLDNFKISAWSQDIYVIFTNLIDNSLYWMNQKKGTKRQITIKLMIDDNSLSHIDYRDSGPGIEPSLIKSGVIFEPEFSTKPEGTGLGLTIASEAAERNGLELKAFESDEGAYFRLQPKMENGK